MGSRTPPVTSIEQVIHDDILPRLRRVEKSRRTVLDDDTTVAMGARSVGAPAGRPSSERLRGGPTRVQDWLASDAVEWEDVWDARVPTAPARVVVEARAAGAGWVRVLADDAPLGPETAVSGEPQDVVVVEEWPPDAARVRVQVRAQPGGVVRVDVRGAHAT